MAGCRTRAAALGLLVLLAAAALLMLLAPPPAVPPGLCVKKDVHQLNSRQDGGHPWRSSEELQGRLPVKVEMSGGLHAPVLFIPTSNACQVPISHVTSRD